MRVFTECRIVLVSVLLALLLAALGSGALAGCGSGTGGGVSGDVSGGASTASLSVAPSSSPSASPVKPPSRAQVKAFVEEAWAYVQKVGKDKAFAAFMDKGGPWFRGQSYIFADAFDGTVLCFPTEPDKVGTSLWDRRDPDGIYPIREMSRVAQEEGSGWVTYKYNNPAQGGQVQQKFTYVQRGGDGWFLGSGTYRAAD